MAKESKPAKYGELWTHDELVLAFDLYCRIPFKKTKASTPEVRDLARLLNRSPAAVARKLGNFGAFDPALQRLNISGLAHGSKLDREVWDEFHRDWNDLVLEANRLRESCSGKQADDVLVFPTGPSERIRQTKQRVHQAFFRATILSNYECRCCITGLTIAECLVASHIVPWSRDERHRTDPTNGLCLSATFDRLFDAGLIGIDDDLTVRISNKLRSVHNASVTQQIFIYHGRPILPPSRFMPNLEYLEWHRENIFE
jgi:putative restriction endonuclease